MAKRAQVQKGIIYKFRFKKDGKTHITTLLFEERNEKGRLVFYNYETGVFTSMREDRFSYIHRFNLVSETPVNMEIKQVPKECIQEHEPCENELKDQENKMLDSLRSLTCQQRELVINEIKRKPEDLEKELKKLFSDTKENPIDTSRLFTEYFRAMGAIGQKVKNII